VSNALSLAPAFGMPSAVTSPATGVTASLATLQGIVGDGGQSAAGGGTSTWQFQWGTDPAFGSYSSTTATSFSGINVSVSANLSGLSASTKYYVRATATNLAGTFIGPVSSFETSLPFATGLMPSDGTGSVASGVTFSWTYNSGGASGGQTAYSLKVTGTVPGHSGTGPWYWTGSAWTSTQTWVSSSASSVTIGSAFFLPNASTWLSSNAYTWTVALQDAAGQGAYA